MGWSWIRAVILGIILMGTLEAGHVPPPPARPKDHMRSPADSAPSAKGEGVFGPRKVYPVLDGMRWVPLEALPDLSNLKYDENSTWAWTWEPPKDGDFLLPALTLDRSTRIIKLSQDTFKELKDGDRKALIQEGAPILPLLLVTLRLPDFPEGWGRLNDNERKLLEGAALQQSSVRLRAMECLVGIPGSLAEPYRTLALTDTDGSLRRKAAEGFPGASLGALLLLWAHDSSPELESLISQLLEAKSKGLAGKVETLRKADRKDLLKLLKNADLPPEALVVGLERIDIPSFRGDDSKAERKKMETELKKIEEALESHLKKWLGTPGYKAPEGAAESAPGEHEILLWHAALKLGREEAVAKLRGANHDKRWWVRFLVARALGDAWEQRSVATADLLERQRDWFYVVRRAANRSLMGLHRLSVPMEALPALPEDSFVIDQWERWWLQRQGLKGLDDEEGWTLVPLKPDEGNVYSPEGPVKHSYLAGKFGKIPVALVDHNGNGRYDDWGIDNFVAGPLDKPGTFLSHLTRLDGKYHFVKFDPATFMLKLKPYEGPLGTVRVRESYATGFALGFLVIGRGADVTVQLDRAAAGENIEAEVPAGTYEVYAGHVRRSASKAGDNLIAHLGGGGRSLEVTGGTVSEIALGEPLGIEADVDFITAASGKPVLRLSAPRVRGSQGETYFALNPEMTRVEVRILDGHGKVVLTESWKPETAVDKSGADILKEQERDAYLEKLKKETDNDKAKAAKAAANIAQWLAEIERCKREIPLIESGAIKLEPPPGMDPAIHKQRELTIRRQKIKRNEELVRHQATYEKDRAENIKIADQYLGEVASKVYGDIASAFPPLEIPLERLPADYKIMITGEVFFGKVGPLQLDVGGLNSR